MSQVVNSKGPQSSSNVAKGNGVSLVITSIAFLLCCGISAAAQSRIRSVPIPNDDLKNEQTRADDDKVAIGSPEEEMRVKQSLKLLDKEYKQNVERAREAAELSIELRDALKAGRSFGRDETKKLERLEKLARKIRDEAGGSDEESLLNNPPGKLESAISNLADLAESLYKVVAKTPRQVISATVIEKANSLLKLAKITRNFFR
jgi:ribosome-binding protein aMBF1 (putative translation factor)